MLRLERDGLRNKHIDFEATLLTTKLRHEENPRKSGISTYGLIDHFYRIGNDGVSSA